ncbi:hypothetical protein [Streptomyces virginiae]|uniref:Glutamate--cysteine ligase n=1 Tax=Streptomyces virginiae TaxID=1961 RepID=A0ABQ3NDI3_STRVG|nr:hypothetical protein [Streptomyces virginiae]MBP2346153.1 hypothetical protein [Streptomyces virginiae]GGQ21039.1 hypothetical protein GCM10010215_52130 [Streptomyces virginiae]GHI10839.1 hypothetical protein Scinn_03020 [Streptomyces virginiae]
MKVYPYPRLTGAVTARVTAVRLRGPGDSREQLDSRRCSVVEQVVALGMAERDDWHTARLSVTATVPSREIEAEGRWSDVAVIAVLTEGGTNTRVVGRLEPCVTGGREWTGEVEINRDDHLDRAALVVHVVAAVQGVAGRVIGSTEQEWWIDVASDVPLRDRQLDVTTVSFARGAEWLRSFRDAPWIVDTSGRMPAVRLNSDFEGFAALVQDPGSKMESMVSEILLAQMCADVWTAVFHTAIGDLEIEDDGSPLFPPDWRGAVLREMLPDIVPGRSVEHALREVHTRRTGSGSWTDLQPRIQYAAARRAEIPRALASTVRDIERFDQESDA